MFQRLSLEVKGYCTLFLIKMDLWSMGALPCDRTPWLTDQGSLMGWRRWTAILIGFIGVLIILSLGSYQFFYLGAYTTIFFLWLLTMCILTSSSHFLIVKTLQVAEVSVIQLFSYLQLVFCSITGVIIFQKIQV